MKKTILYGNGLNYHPNTKDKSITWGELLADIMNGQVFITDFLPNTLAYERIRLNWNRNSHKLPHLKNRIKELLKNQPANSYYEEILKIDCDNYITTNYDYAINKTFLNSNKQNSETNNSSEELYSIRRNTSLIANQEKVKTIWNIHGELSNPKSIMLGLNHYSGSIGKIADYLKGTYDFRYKGQKNEVKKIEEKLKGNLYDEYSWIELFFNSNLHIIGFGLDFSEIDLWWLLTKRARLIEDGLINNSVSFYVKPLSELEEKIDKEKDDNKKRNQIVKLETESRKYETLLELNVDVKEISSRNGYSNYWNEIFETIKTSS
ncbi:hypothetical protein HNS38_16600 [Lentimicrobium sp. L6]|uniref:SIR2 family protein n=1 Tax=Lentimicrobium sp. L6 TaxID=2735916 RepID=UPI001552038A|nr:SIR2 family protein [Lentimicrobium sp. L6]NPD86394.1 hypothetical protein [Lentimicrobium sp. L6]